MNRRHLLVGSVSALTILSGCTDGDSISAGVTSEPADMKVDGIDLLPPEIELGEETTVEISVTNHGGTVGNGELWYSVGRDTGSFVVDLEGGETETYSKTYSFDRISDISVELDPHSTSEVRDLDHTATIDVGPKHLDSGESWKNAEGYTITIEEPDIRESYQAERGFSGEVETFEPENEDLFAFVPVSVENDRDGSGTVPIPRNYFARVNGELYELGIIPGVRRPDFRADLEGIELFTGGEILPGTTKNGYLVFEVPSDAENQFETAWTSRYSPDQVVYWD